MIYERAHVVGLWALLMGMASALWTSVGDAEEQRPPKTLVKRGGGSETSQRESSTRLLAGSPVLGWSSPALGWSPPLLLTAAPQDEQAGTFERLFWTGPSAGKPSDAKRVTLISAYALSVVSVGLTGYWAYSWLDHRAQEQKSSVAGACYDLADGRCLSAIQAQRDRRTYERLTAGGAAATGAFLVSGLLVARYWENTTIAVDVGDGLLGARVGAQF